MKFGELLSWLFDIKCTYQTTLNGELFLLMLIEMLSERSDGKIQCISANTDGIVCKIPRELEDLYKEVCKEWETITEFNLEYADYCKYVRTSVNDYIAVKDGYYEKKARLDSNEVILKKDGTPYTYKDLGNDYVKCKGDFLYDPNDYKKGFNQPIVSKALLSYFVDGIPYRETIMNHTDIYDFCISQKMGGKYQAELHSLLEGQLDKENITKNLRFYASNSGKALVKQDKNSVKSSSILKKKLITILNRFEDKPISEYDINYSYYISQVEKITNQIFNITLGNKVPKRNAKVKDIRGGMFDEHFNI